MKMVEGATQESWSLLFVQVGLNLVGRTTAPPPPQLSSSVDPDKSWHAKPNQEK